MAAEFTPLEVSDILCAKNYIKMALASFNMTIQKLGSQYTKSYFVSGGCVGSFLRGETPNDYDVYFISRKLAEPIINLYTNDDSYKGMVKDVDPKYRDVKGKDGKMITENAITLNDKVQLITIFYGDPMSVRSTFDFEHCKPYYDPKLDKLYISREQYDLNKNKKLKINSSNVNGIQSSRTNKFIGRGWSWQ